MSSLVVSLLLLLSSAAQAAPPSLSKLATCVRHAAEDLLLNPEVTIDGQVAGALKARTLLGRLELQDLASDPDPLRFNFPPYRRAVVEIMRNPDLRSELAQALEGVTPGSQKAALDAITKPGQHGRPKDDHELFLIVLANKIPVLQAGIQLNRWLSDGPQKQAVESQINSLVTLFTQASRARRALDELVGPSSELLRIRDDLAGALTELTPVAEATVNPRDGIGDRLYNLVTLNWGPGYRKGLSSKLDQHRRTLSLWEEKKRPLSLIVSALTDLDTYVSLSDHYVTHPVEPKAGTKVRVAAPVSGLYDSIQGRPPKLDGYVFTSEVNGKSHLTTVRRKGRGQFTGSVENLIDLDTKTITLQNTRLIDDTAVVQPIPSFINQPAIVPMVEGRGTPTLALLTLQQMKAAGVPYGGLKTAKTSQIGNVATILELWRSKPVQDWLKEHPGQRVPVEVLEKGIWGTATVRTFNTVLLQSGHRIREVHVKDPLYLELSDFVFDSNRKSDRLQGLLSAKDVMAPEEAYRVTEREFMRDKWLKSLRAFRKNLREQVPEGFGPSQLQTALASAAKDLGNPDALASNQQLRSALAYMSLRYLDSGAGKRALLAKDGARVLDSLQGLWMHPTSVFAASGMERFVMSPFTQNRGWMDLLREYVPNRSLWGSGPESVFGNGTERLAPQLPDHLRVPAFYKLEFELEPYS